MKRRTKPRLTPRKLPQQERSRSVVTAILEAAIRVLQRDGARGFTTIRVAERAGISVGSLYQYFPNKEAILFRLQSDEWTQTWGEFRRRLFAEGAPETRLRDALRFFFTSEAEEAELRRGLLDARALLRDAPETHALAQRASEDMAAFVREVAPSLSPAQRRLQVELLLVTVSAVAERCTEKPTSPTTLRTWADATTELVLGSLDRAAAKSKRNAEPGLT